MERHWTLIAAAVLLTTVGCATTAKTTANAAPQSAWEQFQQRAEKVVGIEKPAEPASEFACAWQNRLHQLPDPSRGGQMTNGVVGQIFLYARATQPGEQDYAPAEINGDLVIAVTDATPRPPGTTPLKKEVWHFTKETLRKMVVNDERFGRSILVFLPWPDGWNDVYQLSMQARYDQPGGTTLYARAMSLTLDMANGAAPSANGTGAINAVPDPKMVMKKMSEPNAPSMTNTIQQTGTWSPPPQFDTRDPMFAPPPPSMAPVGQWAPPDQGTGKPNSPAEFKRMVIPRK